MFTRVSISGISHTAVAVRRKEARAVPWGCVCGRQRPGTAPFFSSGIVTARRKLLCCSSEKFVAIPEEVSFKSITRINYAKDCQEGRGNRFLKNFEGNCKKSFCKKMQV